MSSPESSPEPAAKPAPDRTGTAIGAPAGGPADAAAPAASPAQQFWYLSGIGSWFAAFGIQAVTFPWITAFLLQESPLRIGMAQASLWLPLLLFLLVGGAVADRHDLRRIMIVLHVAALVPPAVVALLEGAGMLTFWPIIAYGLAMGTIMAFLQPARDGLLSRIAGGRIQRMVLMTIALQYGPQLCGTLAAGLTGLVGLIPVLGIQVAILAFGVLSVTMLHPAPPEPGQREAPLRAIGNGLRLVAGHATIRTVVAMGAFVGFFYVGGFLAILPVLVRDAYGSAEQFAAFYAVWATGSVIVMAAIIRFGPLSHPGRALLLSILGSSACMLIASFAPPTAWMFALMLVWGGIAGISASMSRTVVQQLAPPRERARVLATFQLGFMGSVPVGAFLGGWLTDIAGPGHAMWAAPIAVLPLALWVLAGRRVWAYRPAPEG